MNDYEKGFIECQNMCIKIVKDSSIDGKLDVLDSANYLIEKIKELCDTNQKGDDE